MVLFDSNRLIERITREWQQAHVVLVHADDVERIRMHLWPQFPDLEVRAGDLEPGFAWVVERSGLDQDV